MNASTAAPAAHARKRIAPASKRPNDSTHDQSKFRDDGVDWAALARTGQPIVLYMAMRNLAAIADELMRGGLPPGTPAAIVVAATTADERIVISTLARVAADAQQHQLGTPSIIVVGNIVNVRQHLLDALAMAESEGAR